MRNNRKKERSKSKDGGQMHENLNCMKEDLDKMVQGGWGAHQRAKHYVKRGTGAGGGFYGNVELSPPQKSSKSHK